MAFHKFEAGVYLDYLAPDFLFVFFKSFSNKKLSKIIHQKSLIYMYALFSLSQSSSFKDTSLLPLLQPRLRKTRSLS